MFPTLFVADTPDHLVRYTKRPPNFAIVFACIKSTKHIQHVRLSKVRVTVTLSNAWGRIATPFLSRVLLIISPAPCPKVRRITAGRVIATVANHLPIGHRANINLVGEHMRPLHRPISEPQSAIPLFRQPKFPWPALIGATDLDVSPKSLDGAIIVHSHGDILPCRCDQGLIGVQPPDRPARIIQGNSGRA